MPNEINAQRPVISPRMSLHTRALVRAVGMTRAEIEKVQGRHTDNLRIEDAVRGLEVHGREVHAFIDESHGYKKDGLRAMLKELLKKNGASDVRVELYPAVSLSDGVVKMNEALAIRHQYRDLSPVHGINNFAVGDGNVVKMVLKAGNPYPEDEQLKIATDMLAKAGIKGATIEVVKPSIEPNPQAAAVARALETILDGQNRGSDRAHPIDDIAGLALDTDGKTVRVLLKPRPDFTEERIGKTVLEHLKHAGFQGTDLTFTRPLILPQRPRPSIDPVRPTSMKGAVLAFQRELEGIHNRGVTASEGRIEDAVKLVRVAGAKVIVTLQQDKTELFVRKNVEGWVRDELKNLGINLPVKFIVDAAQG
jgi:hypothetical protein